MDNQTNRLAQLIATAADKELGTRPDGQPRRQDKAAALAIEAEYLFIRRAELPEVRESAHDPNSYYVGTDNVVFTSEENARKWVMADIAVWQHIAAKEDAAREAKQALDKRRDELAREIAGEAEGDPHSQVIYKGMVKTARIAIDRIIELEGKAA
ncbi:hypothetical protein [Paenarthrobacter sp. JL.01a]|uniref:hypothetical protein n=1 Tax=Paenarthrobacter sp. JL.01a TaxID=2979324 RepID=UPI0021C7D5DA|nr:hypothetical protein [Paenarthrobacter sp. JL.01a]UXM90931.1 hypothetical protein N5P29_16770 [Paenarthrobacter sp. JL.01a]